MRGMALRQFSLLAATAVLLVFAALYNNGIAADANVGTAEAAAVPGSALEAMPLLGRVIAVDAGHGGYDGGCVSPSGIIEKDLNLDIALKLRDLLKEGGAIVVMTREEDVALCPPGTPNGKKKKEDMKRRGEIILDAGAELVLSIHMNKYPKSRYYGAQVFYQKGDETGAYVARCIQNALREGLDEKNKREAAAGDYYMCHIGPPGVLVECGFLSNPMEEKLLGTEEYRAEVAQAIYNGVVCLYTAGLADEAPPEQ